MTHEHHALFMQTGVDGRDVYDRLPPVSRLVRPAPTQPARPQRFVRQAASTLTPEQQQTYVAGIERLVASGAYRELVALHDMRHTMHGGGSRDPVTGAARFLPWHRQYLVVFEEALGRAIPYWDYEQGFPPFLAGVRPLGMPPRTFAEGRLPTATEVEQVIGVQVTRDGPPGLRHQEFSSLVETGTRAIPMHNQVHRWVGGVMATPASPTDPVFWLHHAAVDRMWSLFQQRDPEAYPDRLTGLTATLDPWDVTVADVLDVTRLGYSYA